MSILTVNTGSMFSGKSTMLINQGEKHLKAGQKVLYVKPSIDTRYGEMEIVTHDGLRVPALSIGKGEALSEHIKSHSFDVVLIDEAQFFEKRICNGVWWLLSEGTKVYVSGLDLNFLGDGFETMAELMAMADKVNKLKAVCESCGKDAVITGKRRMEETDLIDLGSKETYAPLCRSCWFKHVSKGGIL